MVGNLKTGLRPLDQCSAIYSTETYDSVKQMDQRKLMFTEKAKYLVEWNHLSIHLENIDT